MNSIKIVDILKELLDQFASRVPDILGAFFVILIGWLLAKLLSRLIKKFLIAVKVDRFAERLNEIELISNSQFNVRPSALISKIIYYLMMIITAIAATDILGMPAVSNLMSDIINYIPNLLTAMLVLAVGVFVSDFIKKLVETTCKSLAIPSAKIISSAVFWFLFIIVLMSALAQAKVNTQFITSAFIVIIGGVALAFSIGYGLASKNIMSDYLASFSVKRKFAIGDKIKIGEIVGEIVELDNTTVVLLSDNGKIRIPANRLTSEIISIY